MIKVTDTLFRGPRPKSLSELSDFKRVIDLQSGVFEDLHEDQYEIDKKSGKFTRPVVQDFSLSNIFPPKNKLVWGILAALEFVHEFNPNYRVYIHCLRGKDRTGFICAAFRMQYQGWNYRKAVDEMLSLGFNKWIYFWWIPFLKQYENKK